MARGSQTYLLSLTIAEFHVLTRAIMCESNRMAKIQGFGRCLEAWLTRWEKLPNLVHNGEINPPSIPRKAPITHPVYVALNRDATRILRKLRERLPQVFGRSVTVAEAIMWIVQSSLADNQEIIS